MAGKSTSLLRLVQDRALSKKEAEEEKQKQEQNRIPYIPKDCVSNTLVRLPLESLQRSRFVCKPWYKIINTSTFIDAHLSRSENVLIFLTNVLPKYHPYAMPSVPQEKPNNFSVEAKLFQIESVPIFQQPHLNSRSKYIVQYMEISDGKSNIVDYNATCLGKIRASCNGLILLDNKLKEGGLIVLNPVTRKMTGLPVGTIYPSHEESYGLALCSSTSQYKLVHLFRDELQYISCEILDIGSRSWRVVDGPSFGLFTWFGYNPVHAIGALNWVPHIDHSEYVVSISMENEKFHKIPLPKNSRTRDGIIEMGGLLGFVTHEGTNQIDVWILRSLFGEEWTKQHSITVSLACVVDMVPLCCTKINGEMVFKSDKDNSLHAYDFQLQAMRKVETKKGSFPIRICYLPHVNSLVSWQTHGEGDNMDD